MNKIFAILFAVFCFITVYISNSIMGAGMWFWIILFSGLIVAISQFFTTIQVMGSVIAVLLSLISLAAIALGLLAATIGGSFHLDLDEWLLLGSFLMIAISGFILVIVNARAKPHKISN